MKSFFGIILIVGGIIGGLYVGGWIMFIQPIIQACIAFDAGMLTGLIVGTTILKCIFATTVGAVIAYIGIALGAFVNGL